MQALECVLRYWMERGQRAVALVPEAWMEEEPVLRAGVLPRLVYSELVMLTPAQTEGSEPILLIFAMRHDHVIMSYILG